MKILIIVEDQLEGGFRMLVIQKYILFPQYICFMHMRSLANERVRHTLDITSDHRMQILDT